MADEVAKLYASIGFKVKADELKKAKKILEDFASKLSSANSEASKVISAAGKKEVKDVEDNQKQILRIERRTYSHRINELKVFSRKATNIWRDLKKVALLPVNAAKWMAFGGKTAFQYMEPSLQQAYDFENFSFESGMKLSDFQRFQRMFALSGIRMSAQDIMSDMLSAQRNLTNVALNQGGVLDAYKLTDVREAAERNDLNAVINGIIRGLQDKRIDNSMLVKLVEMFQLGHKVEWARLARSMPMDNERFARTFLDEEGRKKTNDAFKQINLAGVAFKNLRDNITAKASPFLQKFAEGLLESASILIERIKKGDFDELFETLAQAGRDLVEWLKSIKPEDIREFVNKINDAGKIIISVAKFFAEKLRNIGEHLYAIIGAIIGATFGSLLGPAGTAGGALVGGTIGHILDKNAQMSEDEIKAWNKAIKGKDYFPLDEAMGMNNIVGNASKTPAKPTILYNTINNYIDTTLNGLDDEQKKDEFEKIIRENTHNQKGYQIGIGRDYNLVFVSGESVGSGG